MRKLRIVTIAHGEKFVSLFERCLLRSLRLPGNVPALIADGREIEHLILTMPKDVPAIEMIPDIDGVKRIVSAWSLDGVCLPSNGLLHAMRGCLEDNSLMVMATPDMFYGDGSLTNLVRYGADRHLCLAGLHLRVNESILDYFTDSAVSSQRLVRLAFEHLHPSAQACFVDVERNGSFTAGLMLQRLGDGLYSCINRAPNIVLASLQDSDVEHFENGPSYWPDSRFKNWDWSWPAELIPAGRFKVLTSSDLFFAVEITEPGPEHVTPLATCPMNDEFFHRDRLHFGVNRCFVGTLRAETK